MLDNLIKILIKSFTKEMNYPNNKLQIVIWISWRILLFFIILTLLIKTIVFPLTNLINNLKSSKLDILLVSIILTQKANNIKFIINFLDINVFLCTKEEPKLCLKRK